MIVEVRTYTIVPGLRQQFLHLFETLTGHCSDRLASRYSDRGRISKTPIALSG